MKISKDISEHYTWGNNCDGWHLLKTDNLSIIQERMFSGTNEAFHFHHKTQQLIITKYSQGIDIIESALY